MSKPQVKIVDVESGEEIIRDATAKEITQMEIDAANDAAKRVEAETIQQAKQAILDRIGLTAEELQTILG